MTWRRDSAEGTVKVRRTEYVRVSGRLRKNVKPITNIDDPRYVKAISHPLRIRILAILSERTASPVELAEWLDASLGVVAYHVRTLYRVGLIELVKETRVRGAVEHHYRARERPRVSDEAWAAAPPIAKQAAVGSALQMINDYANASAAAGGFDGGDAHLTRTMMTLDQQGWEELSRACTDLLERAQEIEESAKKRVDKDPHAEGTSSAAMVLMLFEAVRLSELPASEGATGTRKRKKTAAAAE
jgi:DNA-binding transcriptional ArsR family regulator